MDFEVSFVPIPSWITCWFCVCYLICMVISVFFYFRYWVHIFGWMWIAHYWVFMCFWKSYNNAGYPMAHYNVALHDLRWDYLGYAFDNWGVLYYLPEMIGYGFSRPLWVVLNMVMNFCLWGNLFCCRLTFLKNEFKYIGKRLWNAAP